MALGLWKQLTLTRTFGAKRYTKRRGDGKSAVEPAGGGGVCSNVSSALSILFEARSLASCLLDAMMAVCAVLLCCTVGWASR